MAYVADQFKGLPMADLIGGPLEAASDAQLQLANATAKFITIIGFEPGTSSPPGSLGEIRTATFKFNRPVQTTPENLDASPPVPATFHQEEVTLDVPLLSVVKVPALAIDTVDITFDMEVKSSTSDTESSEKSLSGSLQAKFGWGPVSGSVKIAGSVSSHKENTRSTDNSAKYHVEVHASDKGMPEGLARVMDIMHSAIAPTKIEAK